MKGIMHVLLLKAAIYYRPKSLYIHPGHRYFGTLIILGKHFGYINIFIAIIVNVGYICTHREKRHVVGGGFYLILKCAVFLVNKHIVIVGIIIRYKNIFITILIQVCIYN